MNLIELEPARVNSLNVWWINPESGHLLDCLEKLAQKAMVEFAELRTKSKADNGNANFAAAAEEKLVEAADYETAVKVLKSFFPDGPFIQRIEL